MKIRRMFALALVLGCATLFASANADETTALDEIGVRYTPSAGEVFVTRNHMDAQALTSLGTDSAMMLAAMEREGLYLVSLMPDGRQYSLGISAKPEGITSGEYLQMTADEKDAFIAQLARKGGYGSATWQKNGYALFSSSVEAQGDGSLTYSDISLSTLYLNSVYTFRMDLIGREAQQADRDLLLSAAERTLLLGAKAETAGTDTEAAQTLTLPSTAVESQPAKLTYIRQDCALTLDPIADTIGVTRFTLTGTTVPGGYLRYSVNGKNSSRIKADETGAFSFTVPNLTGDVANAIELTAFKGEQKTIVDFTVSVDWQTTPLAMEATGIVTSDSVSLKGLTLPGSIVTLTQGRGSGIIAVGEDGTFDVTLHPNQVGANDFTLQVLSAGYHRNDYAFTITRAESDADTIARLQKKVHTVEYTKLIGRPSAYKDKVITLSGQVTTLSNVDGSPRFVLTTENGDHYTVLCADLLTITQGASITLLGTLSGSVSEVDGYPLVALEAILS